MKPISRAFVYVNRVDQYEINYQLALVLLDREVFILTSIEELNGEIHYHYRLP